MNIKSGLDMSLILKFLSYMLRTIVKYQINNQLSNNFVTICNGYMLERPKGKLTGSSEKD
jgi:hypothetical protein